MQGAGNDFVVLDETQIRYSLTAAHYRFLADRHFGVGADQILTVRASTAPGIDFSYIIHNADGREVEHCGNGARCFARFVHEQGLTPKRRIRVETVNNLLELQLQDDGRVTVDMNRPVFELARLPFDASGLVPRIENGFECWPLDVGEGRRVDLAVLSMGNPHAVQRVLDVREAPVAELGPRIEQHPRFARKVNVGFMQVVSRGQIALRVHERDAGETLACGTGACAAVVAGIRLGWLDRRVDVQARGGLMTIEWADDQANVLMTGPAQTVFHGEIEL
jgi:diaminopimelate epimerase